LGKRTISGWALAGRKKQLHLNQPTSTPTPIGSRLPGDLSLQNAKIGWQNALHALFQ
jgi:hypothetical protein